MHYGNVIKSSEQGFENSGNFGMCSEIIGSVTQISSRLHESVSGVEVSTITPSTSRLYRLVKTVVSRNFSENCSIGRDQINFNAVNNGGENLRSIKFHPYQLTIHLELTQRF